jgi:formylglycine-generating enzyme required for sulfatase activity
VKSVVVQPLIVPLACLTFAWSTGCWVHDGEYLQVGVDEKSPPHDTASDTIGPQDANDTNSRADTVSPIDSDAKDTSTPSETGDSGSAEDEDEHYDVATIPSQTFPMGCDPVKTEFCDDHSQPLHTITLTHSWKVDLTEVTQGEYARLMEGDRPSAHSICGDACPVENLTWHMAAAYANQRSEESGLTPYYLCTGIGEDISCEPTGNPYLSPGWRLLTEAEWEASARCGHDHEYSGSDAAEDVGWFMDNSDRQTHPVASLSPNDCGLFDMSGNVREWVHDGYGSEYYAETPDVDPTGPELFEYVVSRGGNWGADMSRLRVFSRDYNPADDANWFCGFRLARTIF